MESDVIVDFPKILQEFMDNRNNRRSYSKPSYDTDNHKSQMGGDYIGSPIVFKRRTNFRDKTGKYIYEWDYVLINGEEYLIQINGGLLLIESKDNYEGSLSKYKSKELEIIREYDFGGKIVIKGINATANNISNMERISMGITYNYNEIMNGSKSRLFREF